MKMLKLWENCVFVFVGVLAWALILGYHSVTLGEFCCINFKLPGWGKNS